MHMSKRKEIPQIIFFAQLSRFTELQTSAQARDSQSKWKKIQEPCDPIIRLHFLPPAAPCPTLHSHYTLRGRQCYKVGRRAHKFSFHSGSFLRHATAVRVGSVGGTGDEIVCPFFSFLRLPLWRISLSLFFGIIRVRVPVCAYVCCSC